MTQKDEIVARLQERALRMGLLDSVLGSHAAGLLREHLLTEAAAVAALPDVETQLRADAAEARIAAYPKNVARLEDECARLDAQLIVARVGRREAESQRDAMVEAVLDHLDAEEVFARTNDVGDAIEEAADAAEKQTAALRGVLADIAAAGRERDERLRAEGRDAATNVHIKLTRESLAAAREEGATAERARTQEVAERVATQAAKNGAALARGDEGSFPSVKDLVRLHCGPETAEERELREARAAVCAAALHRTDVPWQLVERLRAAEKAKSDAAERSGR